MIALGKVCNYYVTYGCWAMPDGATVKTSKAAVGCQYCNKLFSLKKKCANQKDKYRREYRQNIISPVPEDAVRYSRNQKRQMNAFLEYGAVPISNNLAENPIRPLW